MNTQPGIQQTFPWFEGQLPLQPVQTIPEPLPDFDGDNLPHPEAIGLHLVHIERVKQ